MNTAIVQLLLVALAVTTDVESSTCPDQIRLVVSYRLHLYCAVSIAVLHGMQGWNNQRALWASGGVC